MVFGGFHGDEPKSTAIALRLIEHLTNQMETGTDVHWVIVPCVNPDGLNRRRRRNARLVDLNRNFPTKNWAPGSPRSRMYGGPKPASEPETRAVMRGIRRWQPQAIVTIHSISGGRQCNNYDGPGRDLARCMSRHNGYRVTRTIGYPTPGSFGSWAGKELGIPTITLELPSRCSTKRCWEDNREALLSASRWANRNRA